MPRFYTLVDLTEAEAAGLDEAQAIEAARQKLIDSSFARIIGLHPDSVEHFPSTEPACPCGGTCDCHTRARHVYGFTAQSDR